MKIAQALEDWQASPRARQSCAAAVGVIESEPFYKM